MDHTDVMLMRDRPAEGIGRHRWAWPLMAALVGLGCSSTAPLNNQCIYDGRGRAVGESFPSTDRCNSCSCTAMGVACTLRACLSDAGSADVGDASSPDAAPGCAYGGQTYVVGEGFPSTDGCNSCSCGAGPLVACTQRACVDAGPNACAFDRTYRFWNDGGLVAYADRSTLAPARLHIVTRDHLINALPNQCSRELACGDPLSVDLGEIQQAVAHPDVVAALALTSKPFYGTDTRPADGTVFIFERDDQHGFMLGSGSVPAGLTALMDLLHRLQSETVATPACANL